MPDIDLLIKNVHLATFAGDEPYGAVADGALAVAGWKNRLDRAAIGSARRNHRPVR